MGLSEPRVTPNFESSFYQFVKTLSSKLPFGGIPAFQSNQYLHMLIHLIVTIVDVFINTKNGDFSDKFLASEGLLAML